MVQQTSTVLKKIFHPLSLQHHHNPKHFPNTYFSRVRLDEFWRGPGDRYPRSVPSLNVPLQLLHVVRMPPSEYLHNFFGHLGTFRTGVRSLTAVEHGSCVTSSPFFWPLVRRGRFEFQRSLLVPKRRHNFRVGIMRRRDVKRTTWHNLSGTVMNEISKL